MIFLLVAGMKRHFAEDGGQRQALRQSRGVGNRIRPARSCGRAGFLMD
jgi:hypothetical protein